MPPYTELFTACKSKRTSFERAFAPDLMSIAALTPAQLVIFKFCAIDTYTSITHIKWTKNCEVL